MSYIGNTNTTQGFTPAIDYFSGNASTTAFTLSRPVASVAQVQAVVNNVAQNPSDAFTVSGNTITFTSAPSSGTNNIYVYYTSPITQVIAPGQGTVGTTQLQNGLTVNFADGTAAAPSITNDGDTNTGIFFPAADTIGFAEGGAEVMRIDSSGNVGIGTTTPDSRLTISKNSASPAAITGTSYLNIVGANSESPKLNFDAYANLNTIIFRRANGTQASPSALVSGDQMGNFAVFGYGATSYTTTNRGFISFNADENWTDSAQGSRIAFATTTAGTASAATERMRIDSSGNLLFNSGYGSVATAYGCRAWVNFNGTGTVAIRASGNVTSITDNSVGNYTVNFTTAMPDANYAATCAAGNIGGYNMTAYTLTTASVRLSVTYESAGYFDTDIAQVAIFR
jgi:hypothetical protein